MSKFFYHGTDKLSFYKILETGEIKCRRLIEEENIQINRNVESIFAAGANGYEYISVCNKNNYFDENDAFNVFVVDSYCFIISDEVDAIKTINITEDGNHDKYRKEYRKFLLDNSNSDLRFSIMPDEYHVKTSIPLDKIIGIGFPFKRTSKKEIEYLFNLSYQLNLAVVDTGNPLFIEDFESNRNKIEKIKELLY